MNKSLSVFLTLILLVGLTGCSNSTETKSIEEGKLYLADKEYEKALSSFEIALNDGSNDAEVEEIYNILNKYKESKIFLDKKDIKNSEIALSEIDDSYTDYAIKEDIEKLKNEVEDLKVSIYEQEKEDKEESTKNIEEPVEKIPEKAKEDTKQEITSTNINKKNEYLQKFYIIEQKVTQIYDESSSKAEYNPIEAPEKGYMLWDDFLNEIWSVLKNDLFESEMAKLTNEQRQWIANKESIEQTNYDEGLSTQTYLETISQATRSRCKDLIEGYMD